jgi:glycine cleavage system H protein
VYANDRKYTKDHEWIKIENDSGTVGITAYAVEQLGDVVHLELPEVGARFKSGESFGTVESTKTVSDLFMPVDGEVVARNDALLDAPEELPEDPHGKAWLVKIKITGTQTSLLSAADYDKYIQDESAK